MSILLTLRSTGLGPDNFGAIQLSYFTGEPSFLQYRNIWYNKISRVGNQAFSFSSMFGTTMTKPAKPVQPFIRWKTSGLSATRIEPVVCVRETASSVWIRFDPLDPGSAGEPEIARRSKKGMEQYHETWERARDFLQALAQKRVEATEAALCKKNAPLRELLAEHQASLDAVKQLVEPPPLPVA